MKRNPKSPGGKWPEVANRAWKHTNADGPRECTARKKMWEREKEPVRGWLWLTLPTRERAHSTHTSASWFLIHRVALMRARLAVCVWTSQQQGRRSELGVRLWLSWGRQARLLILNPPSPSLMLQLCACRSPPLALSQPTCVRAGRKTATLQRTGWFRCMHTHTLALTCAELAHTHTRCEACIFSSPPRRGIFCAGGALADVASLHLTPRLPLSLSLCGSGYPPSVHLPCTACHLWMHASVRMPPVCRRKRTCINFEPSAAFFFVFAVRRINEIVMSWCGIKSRRCLCRCGAPGFLRFENWILRAFGSHLDLKYFTSGAWMCWTAAAVWINIEDVDLSAKNSFA